MKTKTLKIHQQRLPFNVFGLCRGFKFNAIIISTSFASISLNSLKKTILHAIRTATFYTFHTSNFVAKYEIYC